MLFNTPTCCTTVLEDILETHHGEYLGVLNPSKTFENVDSGSAWASADRATTTPCRS